MVSKNDFGLNPEELSPKVKPVNRLRFSPPKLMLLSFFLLLTMGTALLLLPAMTTNGISFIDALFTATSASCVTGMTILETGTDFTFAGQLVILILIQLGGLSILTFATFFITIFSKSYSGGVRYQHFVKDLLSGDRVADSRKLLKNIIITTLIIEIIGTLFLFLHWKNSSNFSSSGESFMYALFHTISAFNNAGFSLWGSDFMNQAIVYSYYTQTVIMLLVLLGGLGFMTLNDLFNPHIIKERKKYPWKGLMPGSKIILVTTFSIIITATLIFFAVEYSHSLENHDSVGSKMFTSLFQVVASRTAGFNTICVSDITMSGFLLLMLIMFIGASPGSTGGGIKNTTFFVIIKSVAATIRGKHHIEYRRKTIPFDLVDKSYSIVIMSLIVIFISTFFLTLIEPSFKLQTSLFETISAFTTTGLSTGAPVDFSWQGKLILIIDMYIGRIGTLTLAFALSKRVRESKHQYPEMYFMVG